MSVNIKTRLRQARAVMVAQRAIEERLARIEWEEGVLLPTLEKLALEAGDNLEIPQFVIEHGNSSEDN